MTLLSNLSPYILDVLIVIDFLIIVFTFSQLFMKYNYRESARLIGVQIVHATIALLMFFILDLAQLLSYYRTVYDNSSLKALDIVKRNYTSKDSGYSWLDGIVSMPAALAFTIIIVLVAALIYLYFQQKIWFTRNITRVAIKEAINNLPIGLVFYTNSDYITLSNKKMQDVFDEILGTPIWRTKPLLDVVKDENPYITYEGHVYNFVHTRIDAVYNQLVAYDLTEIYNLIEELEVSNEKLAKRNKHLREYNAMVDQTIKNEENLNARIRVHDELGRILLSTKVYLTRDDNLLSREEILNRWRKLLGILIANTEQSRNVESIVLLRDIASQLGIKVNILGDIPDGDEFMHILISGARECITNSVRALANELTIEIAEDSKFTTITYTDDGNDPEYPVTEGGGLSTLRKSLEPYNVNMEIAQSGKFFLKLKIPKILIS